MTLHENVHQSTGGPLFKGSSGSSNEFAEEFKKCTSGPNMLVLVWNPLKGTTLHEKINHGTIGLDMLVFVWNHSKGKTLQEKFNQGTGGPDLQSSSSLPSGCT